MSQPPQQPGPWDERAGYDLPGRAVVEAFDDSDFDELAGLSCEGSEEHVANTAVALSRVVLRQENTEWCVSSFDG